MRQSERASAAARTLSRFGNRYDRYLRCDREWSGLGQMKLQTVHEAAAAPAPSRRRAMFALACLFSVSILAGRRNFLTRTYDAGSGGAKHLANEIDLTASPRLG